MAGLRTLAKQIDDACDEAVSKANRIRNLRDPERARELGQQASRALGEAVEAIAIINREPGAWEELAKPRAVADVCLEVVR